MCESVVPRSFQRSRSAPRVTFSHGVEDFSSRSRYNQHQVRLSPTMCNTTMTSPRSGIRNVTNLPCIAGQRSNLTSGSVSDTRSPLPSDFCPFLPAALQPREHLSLWYATYANQRREQSLRQQQQQQQQQRRVDQPSSSSASLLAVSLVSSSPTSESVQLADQAASSAIPLTVSCDDDDVWIGGHPSAASCNLENATSPRRYCNHDDHSRSSPPPPQQTPNSLNVIAACGGKQAFIRAIQEIYSPSSPIPSPPTSGTGGRGKKQQEVSSEATKLV